METLNHIISIISCLALRSCCICNLCCMMRNVHWHMATLHLSLNCICNKLFFYCALNPINTQKPPN